MQVISSFKCRLLTLATVAALGASALGFTSAARADDAPAAPAATAPAAAESARVEIGTPLQAAQKLIAAKNYKEAMAKVKEADAVPNRTAYENYLLESMRASAAGGMGDDDTAISAYEKLIASGRLPAASQQRILQVIAGAYFKQKKYDLATSTANRYFKAGGNDASVTDLMYMSLYNGNDFKGTSSAIHDQLDADEKAQRTSKELHLQLALNADQKIGNAAGATIVLEKLLASYPKKQYWDIAISHLLHKPGFSERLELDLLRLEVAMGTLHRESDFMDMAQLSLEAGFPAEAKKTLDQGFASGVLGKGAEADRQKRLKDKANKDAADDQKDLSGDLAAEKAKPADAMLKIGMNYVLNGKSEHGISLMEAAIAKGGLRSTEEAKLHLGIALYWAGDKAKAAQVLGAVSGKNSLADLAHLWGLFAASKR